MKMHQVRHLGVQLVRRLVQLSVIGLVFGVVFLSLYAHYRAARALDDPQLMSGWKGKVLKEIDAHVGDGPDADVMLDGYKGTLWSMRVGGVSLSDPLAAVEMTTASKTFHRPLLVSALIPLIVTLVLGRVFCSWICPAGLLFEITGKLRKLLKFAEVPPAEVKFSHRNKYVLLVVGLLVVGIFGLPVFALAYPPAVLSRLAHAWIFGTALTGMLILIGLIIVFELFISPRWWCRTVCPGGALYAITGWSRLLRVKLDARKCTGCRECEPVCEPGLNPVLQSDSIECDNCGVCIQHCDDGALFYTIGLPGRKGWSVGGRKRRRARPRKGGTRERGSHSLPIITSLLLLGLLPVRASAHHILGIPHYSYSENYPQNPTYEYPATSGPYDILLTCYPGEPVPGNPTDLAFYIKDRKSGQPYNQPITVRVLRTFTFGRNREILHPTVVDPVEIPHLLTATFPADGEYVIEMTLDVEGKPEIIPFGVTIGNPTATTSILAAVGIGFMLFIVIVRAIKIKRSRRVANAAHDAAAALG